MPVVYTHQTWSAGGGTLTFTWSGPRLLAPGQAQAVLAPLLAQVGVNTAGYIVRLSRDAFHEEPMASHFQPEVQFGPGLSVFAGTSQADPIFPFLEYDVRAHWPPFGPDSRFAEWADRVGVKNVYLAAKSYASHDHPGRHLMPKVLQQAATVFKADLAAAVQQAARL